MKYFLPIAICIIIFSCSTSKNKTELLPELYNKGARIDYQVAGDGDTTILFVHGWCINKSYWDAQVAYFKPNYTVVTLDLPGHGNSGQNRKEWSIEDFGSDVVMLIDALNLNKIVLIGHSMGGDIILEAASRRPWKIIGFVGVDNFKEVGIEYTPEQLEEMKQFLSMIKMDYKNTISQFAQGMLFAESTDARIEKRVMDDILNTSPEVSVGILESLFDSNEMEGDLFQELDVKVHLINSDAIPTNEKQLEKYCKKSYDVRSIGLTGHYPMVEEPEKFNEILADILHHL